MPKSRIPSPARSLGAITPRRHKSRASRSLCSPAHYIASGRLTSVIDQFKENNLEFELTLVTTRRSVLTDNTDIEEPRRKSWWKNLNENSRDVMEVLDDKATEAVNAIEDIVDIEILSQENKNYTLDLPESSDNESINSIVLPQRKLFTLKENKPQKKFGELVGARDTLAKLHKTQNDKTINAGTKDLFQRNKRSRPVFPAALLNISPDKTVADKTKEIIAAAAKAPVRNIFGSRPANKRKNIFADFIVSESEDEISDIQPKVFGFQKKSQQTSSVGKGREHSPASSITTDMELDEWKLLPSSTMVEHQLDEMVAVTPIKRARLSKLSEAKESEAGTYYTTIDKTKQSNNSSPPVKRTRLSKQLEAESEQGTITTADKTNKESEDEVNIITTINETKQSKKSLPSPVIQANLSPKLNDTEPDLVEKSKQSNKTSHTPVTRARLSKQLDDKESKKETNISTTADKTVKPNKCSPPTPVTRARLSKQLDDKESEKETNISTTADKTKQPNKSLPTPATQARLSKQLDDKGSEKETNISTTKDKTKQPNKSLPPTPVTRTRLSKQLDDKESESEKETHISTTADKTEQLNKSLPSAPVTRARLSKILDNKESEAENNISMTVDKSKLTNKSFSTTPVTRASLSKQLDNEKLEAEINVSTSVNKSKPSKKSISPPEVTQAILSKHVDAKETEANITNQPDELSKSMKSKTSPRNKSNVSFIGDKTVPENENVNNEDNEQNLTLEYEEDEQIVDEEIDQIAQNKSHNNGTVINKTTIENKEIKEKGQKQNQSKAPLVKEAKDNNENKTQADIENDNPIKVDQEREDTTDEIGESKEIEAGKNDNQEMSGTQQNNVGNESEEKDNVTRQDIVNESHIEDVEENVDEEEEETQEDEEANDSDKVDDKNVSQQDDEVHESQENESEDESVNQSTEVENDDEDNVDESEEVEQTNNTSQEIEEVANESQESENEVDDEEDEGNESQEVENDNLSEEDQDMDDSADDRVIASDAMSEEEQEEMEVDEESEESYKENAINSEEVIEEFPNVTHDTTGRNRKKVKSPEVILHDKTKMLDSFIAKGRNTSIRNTKSMYKDLNIRPSLAPERNSLSLSEGTGDSSAEGSGWDSHRTTRKTLRQTFGKDFTPRKSLRALVMEKAAKQTVHMETLNNDTVKPPQANSTELPEYSNREDNVTIESDHEVSRRTRQTTLETYLQKIKQDNMEKKMKMEEAIRNSLKAPPSRDPLNLFKVPAKPMRKPRTSSNKTKKAIPNIFQGELPTEVIEDMKYKPPKRFQPTKASWITKRLYKHLEKKLEPKYDYKARVRAEKLMETIFFFVKELRRHDVASPDAVEMLKHEMARLDIVKTHFEFYEFFHEFMPREVRVKVIPDIVNNIAMPRRGVFSDIIRENTVQG